MSKIPGFPKKMVHPLHRKGTTTAVPGVDAQSGRKFTDYQGTPDRFPPVSVEHPAQEAQHRMQGYILEGEVPPVGIEYNRYPMWMKKDKADDVLVNSKDEEEASIKKGYAAPGTPDPQAAEAAIASPYVPGRNVVEFPKMVDGVVVDPGHSDGFQEYPKWHEGILFNSRAELEAKFPPKPKEVPKSVKA